MRAAGAGADVPDVLRGGPAGGGHGGNVHLAGCATGALVATGMIEVIGRIKSPKPSAKGRRLDLLRLPPENYAKAETFLHRHGVTLRDVQQQLAI